jgi:hypothetical protein
MAEPKSQSYSLCLKGRFGRYLEAKCGLTRARDGRTPDIEGRDTSLLTSKALGGLVAHAVGRWACHGN